MIGEQSIELINIGLLVMQMNGTFQTFIDACFDFPSLAELYKYATYDAMKRMQQGRVQGSQTATNTAELAQFPVLDHGPGGHREGTKAS
jgi:NAD(P) transhydrogenase